MVPKLVIRAADPEDVAVMAAIAEEAYAPCVAVMGRRPAPMDADFDSHVTRHEAYVVQDKHGIGGYIVTYPTESGQFIENVAVRVGRRRTGLGRKLCQFAVLEARRRKAPRVYLYTNVTMVENLSYYSRIGYVETHRITEHGFGRVYMEKTLGS